MSTQYRNDNRAVATLDASVTDAGLEEYSQDTLDLIRQTYAKDLTDAEFRLVIAEGKARDLSVLGREIVGIKFSGRMSTMVTLAGVRKLAARSGLINGTEGPWFCGPDGAWREFWAESSPPIAAKFRVHVKDQAFPSTGIATWQERAQYYFKDGKKLLMPTWASMPALMLGKVAESDAYKRAGLVADVEVVSYDGDEANATLRPTSSVTEQKRGALRHAHQIAGHEQIRAAAMALRPGVESLAEDEVTPADITAAASMAAEFGDDAPEIIEADLPAADPETGEIMDVISDVTHYRADVQRAFAGGDREAMHAVLNIAKANEDDWRWEAMIEFAPTVTVRDRMIAYAESAAVPRAKIDAAIGRRKDTAQIERAAEERAG